MNVKWPAWWKIVNKRFLPLVDNQDRFLILYGSRDSTKSSFVARLLIYRLMTEPYMRMLMVRKFYSWVGPSMWQSVKDTVQVLGLTQLFEFKDSGKQIICRLNGNKLMGAGTDDVNAIKSIAEPTGVWYEEDILNISREDWITITTSIRSSRARFLQDIYTLNPVVIGQDYQQNWFWKMFFEKHEGELSFRDTQIIQIAGKDHKRSYTVHHSTFKNNRWITPDRIMEYKATAETDPFYGEVYVAGVFANKEAEGLFYNQFNRAKHVKSIPYDPARAIHLTFDFNVRPYLAVGIWQVYRPEEDHEIVDFAMMNTQLGQRPTVLCKVGEIAAKPPDNRTEAACNLFMNQYKIFYDALYLYGDPSGKQADTRSEKGGNDYTIIKRALRPYAPRERVMKVAPNVAKRGEYINRILAGLEPYAIVIDPECQNSILDYTNGKEDAEGRKLKKMVKDSPEGIPYQKFHHFTDGDDYFIIKFLFNEYSRYLRDGSATYDVPDRSGFKSRPGARS